MLIKYGGGVRAGKEIMSLVGINSGPGRAPIKKFSSEEKINLKNALEAIDFFDNIKFMNTIETVK